MADAEFRCTLSIARAASGLARLGGWVDEVVTALALSPNVEYSLRLCVEEAVANVVMHGLAEADGGADVVTLGLEAGPEALILTVEDRCGAFDPLLVPPPERPTSAGTARIGGLGVHLMRQYARNLEYARVDGVNRLTLTIGR